MKDQWIMPRCMRILTFSTLFPNAAQPTHGVFVENRLRRLVDSGSVEASVVAPVPWFPFRSSTFGRYSVFARAPERERRNNIAVIHPRFPVIPYFGMTAAPLLLYTWVRSAVRRVCDGRNPIDLIDAHYFYPDGVAAVLLARDLGVPVTITARGTDINLIPRYPLARRQILWAAEQADGLITVCQALKGELTRLGVPSEKIRVLRNGVDLLTFRPMPQDAARWRLGVRAPVLLSVGGLITRKRHDLVIRSLPHIPGATLLIVGSGPERGTLETLCREVGVDQRVRFLGSIPHERMADVYSAGDVLVLASSREGWANVLLEAMACGTPTIATKVWGAPEVITAIQAGRLLDEATPEAVARSVCALLRNPPRREDTRRYAEAFSWDATTNGQLELFREILDRQR